MTGSGGHLSATPEQTKRVIAYRAADEQVVSGMRVGLGTGSTAGWVIPRLGERIRAGELRDMRFVPTSLQTELECERHGVPLTTLNDAHVGGELDVTIDGADEFDEQGRLVKGGWGALLREKILAYSSKLFVALVEERKRVRQLGHRFPVPAEVIPTARASVLRALEQLGGEASLRLGAGNVAPAVTDNGNLIVDVTFPEPFDVATMEQTLNSIPGLIDNGIFARVQAVLYVGDGAGNVAIERPS